MSWHALPTEMQLSVVDLLDKATLESFSQVDRRTYQACVPAKFRVVTLPHYQALERFLETVPSDYLPHIEELDLSTVDNTDAPTDTPVRIRTETVISLLAASRRIIKLSLKVEGSLDKSIVAPFPYLTNLRDLKISNCGDENVAPLSERLAVSIAASVPNLENLSLDNISRSGCHADDLVYNPDVPVVLGDDDIPDHPILGSELALPSLLRIPTLRKLVLRDTHLGDERWITTPVACRLQILDLGSYIHTDEDFNSMCTQRIMSAVGPTVDEFSLATTVSDNLFAKPADTPLRRLRKLHISPFFPVDSVVDTVSNLAGSPIESLSLQCFEEDVVDVCSALEGFLSVRVERGPQFFDKLKRIHVTVTTNEDATMGPTLEESEGRAVAAERLQSFCRDLHLSSAVVDAPGSDSKAAGAATQSPSSFTQARRFPTRSMTI